MIIHYLIFFYWNVVASLVRAVPHMCFSWLFDTVREDSINFLPCVWFDSTHKDKILFLLIKIVNVLSQRSP